MSEKFDFEAALEGELNSHLAEEPGHNRRNGKSKKTVKSTSGKFELETPRFFLSAR